VKPYRSTLLRAFGYAMTGIWTAVQRERNMKIHIAAAVSCFIAAALLQLDKISWLFLISAVAAVFIAELVNTAVEAVIDLASPTEHPLARVAKDTAAGASLVAAVYAAAVGILIFWEPLMQWVQSITG